MTEAKSSYQSAKDFTNQMVPQGFKSVKDSGARQAWATGSVRDTRTGKGRFDLLPPYPLQRLAQHFENGAVKYGDRNWEKGQHLMRYLDSATRHINDWKYETMTTGKLTEDHLAAAVWNLMCFIHTEHMIEIGLLPNELNDKPVPDFAHSEVPNLIK